MTQAAPPLTEEDLLGEWEAAFDVGGRDIEFYRMEIRKEAADSYLIRMAGTGDSAFIAGLVSSEVHAGNVLLQFATEPEGRDRVTRHFSIQGYGAASTPATATITGKFISLRAGNRPGWDYPVVFKKGSWTRVSMPLREKPNNSSMRSAQRGRSPEAAGLHRAPISGVAKLKVGSSR